MKNALLALLLAAQCASAGLERYADWVVADVSGRGAPQNGGVRVTYLGVSGYQFETGGHALLVDPYFTRANLCSFVFNCPIKPNAGRVAAGLAHMARRADAVLVTHAHADHLLDVPAVMRQTGARLYAGPTAVNLVTALGVPQSRCRPLAAGAVRRIGPWTIRVLAARHDRVIGAKPPYSGHRAQPGPAPVRPSDWVLGEPLAFLIEAAGKRIYIDSGGAPGAVPEVRGPVDLAILGMALPDARARLAPNLEKLRPRYFLPSHQDDFFRSFDHGFVFGALTDFPGVLRAHRRGELPGRLILMDYFVPWTLR